jgi:DNA-binding MarR family transcriptional regulator
MSGIVDGLEEDALVKRTADPSDRRLVRVHASAKGNRVLQRARERRIAALAEKLSGLDPGEVEIVRKAADLVDDALRRSSALPPPAARGGGSAGSRA